MIYILCSRLNTAIEVERARETYANLKSILTLLEMEQSQDYKSEKNINLQLSDKIDFDCFICEGIRYLGMINNMISWITPNSTKNMILRKTLNVFGKVQFQYKRMLRLRDLLLSGIIENGIREDFIICIDNVIQENNELEMDDDNEYEVNEYELIDFYDWQNEKKTRTKLLKMIYLSIDKIYYAILKRYLTLHSMIKKYCERATQFLCSNRKILKFSNFDHQEMFCCKYHFLKQLIGYLHHIL